MPPVTVPEIVCQSIPGIVGAPTVEMLEHLGHGGEEGVKALAARFMHEGLGEMRLAGFGWAADQYVALLTDKVATGQL